jgi:uncharacterized membrane protein YfcA
METIFIVAIFAFLLGGTVKGAIGIGLPTTVVSVLAQVTDPRTAIALGLMSMIISNIWQMVRQGQVIETVKGFWPIAVTTAAVMYLISLQAAEIPFDTILMLTGVAIAIFAGASLIGEPPELADRWDRPGQVIAGVGCGVMGGLTGIWSPPMLIFLLARRLQKEEFVRAMGFLLFTGAVPLLAGYAQTGLMTERLFTASCLLLIPTFMGYWLGEKIRARMDARRFQKAVLWAFLIMGLNLVRRGLMG